MNAEPISEKPKPSGCYYLPLLLFGAVFFLAGCFFFWFTVVVPYWDSQASADWIQSPCTITTSTVDIDNSGDGTTYRPKIEFDYEIAGEKFHSDTYDFTALNRSRKVCREIVAAHPVGAETNCFYNPKIPSEAVIVRDYEHSWLAFCLPLVFSLIGLAVMICPFVYKPKTTNAISGSVKETAQMGSASLTNTTSKDGKITSEHPGDIEDREWDAPQKLKPENSRWVMFAAVTAAALFWNGLTGFGVYSSITDGLGDAVSIFFLLFMIPFVLVGCLLILASFHQLFTIFNAKVELALSSGAVPLGGAVDVAWQLEGRTSRIKKLRIYVEGVESATYRSGTDTLTDHETFSEILIVETTDPQEIIFGSQSITIPLDTMHTFEATHNNVKWTVEVRGEIPWWPDIYETFPFRVKPS